ncbi:MAG: tRNA (N6-threonylcarbamoyladenosine(37)-N6)-methyltransferase TrmO [Lachnospiraceae bacterium]
MKPSTDDGGSVTFRRIARIRTDFPEKFGIPRQGLLRDLQSTIVFEPEFRNEQALRGIEGFSHLWLLWEFSENEKSGWSPMVKPPRLGGNRRMGVFATRSPFRPNPIGLTAVRLIRKDLSSEDAPALIVAGADLMDGTPILDIKPYLPYADCIPGASGGFTDTLAEKRLRVVFPEEWLEKFPPEKRGAAVELLSEDPRPAYQDDPDRVYGAAFAGMDIHFTVRDGVLTVRDAVPYVKKARQGNNQDAGGPAD